MHVYGQEHFHHNTRASLSRQCKCVFLQSTEECLRTHWVVLVLFPATDGAPVYPHRRGDYQSDTGTYCSVELFHSATATGSVAGMLICHLIIFFFMQTCWLDHLWLNLSEFSRNYELKELFSCQENWSRCQFAVCRIQLRVLFLSLFHSTIAYFSTINW